jgi:dipeptidyl aminopeptidase/acylaminoacyl peptidase
MLKLLGRRRAFYAIPLFVLCLGFSPAAEKRPWNLEDAFRTKDVRDLALSPDGTLLYFVLSETAQDANHYQSSIWVVPTGGGVPRSLTERDGSASSLRLSPDGMMVAYLSVGRDGITLWRMKGDGTDKRRLAVLEQSNSWLGETGSALCWSPDGKQLAYTAAGPRHYSNTPSPQDPPNGNNVLFVERLQFKAAYYYGDLRRTHVWVVNAEGGAPRQISAGEYDYHSIAWSPDGKSIACISNRTGRDDYNSNNDICLLSTEGKELVQLSHTVGPEYHPLWSPDGSKLAYLGRVRDHRSKESDAEFMKVYVIPSQGGDTVNVTALLDRWCSSTKWSADGTRIYFTAQDLGRVCLYSATADGKRVTPLIEERGQVRSFTVGRNGELYYAFADCSQPGEIFAANPDGSLKRKLTEFNAAFTEEVEIAPAEEFSYRSFDSLEMQGFLLRPHGFTPGVRYPMVLDIHGGPHSQYTYTISARLQYYAAHGYVVVFVNPRGSTGRGQSFSDLCVGDLGGGDYQDVMAGVEYVLGHYDFIDPRRMGVTGISYGGYLTNWVITHTNRFKAAVPISSICNLISMWGTGCNTDWFESDMGFMPIDDFERAWSVSPLKYIKHCTTPTLFVSGAWDFVTTLDQAEEMFVALKKSGVDAALAAYPNEGHGVRNEPRHTADYYRRSLAWFDKYLK